MNYSQKIILILINCLFLQLLNAQNFQKVDSLIALLEKASGIEKANLLKEIGDNYQKTEHYHKAIINYEKALKIRDEYKDTLFQASVLGNIGLAYYYLFDFDAAIGNYLNALKLYEKMNNPKGILSTLNHIGSVYEKCLNKEKTLEYYLKSYEMSKLYEDADGICNSLNNIGLVYLNDFKDYKKALEYLKESLIEAKKINDTIYISIQIQNIAHAYLLLEEYDTSLSYFLIALKLDEKNNYKLGIGSNCCNMANLYIKVNKIETAKEYLDRSFTISKEIDSKGLKLSIYNLYTLYYALNGNISKMWENAYLSDAIQDSIYNEQSMLLIAEMQTKYDTEKKEQEIVVLATENKLKESLLKIRSFLLLIISLLFISIIIFIILKRKLLFTQRNLVQKNIEIVKSESKLNDINNNSTGFYNQYEDDTTEQPFNRGIKYTSSQLTEEEKLRIEGLLIKYFKNSKNYLNKDYSINVLARECGISRTYISQVINEKFNMNFICFLNEKRIIEARKIMSDSSNLKYTIESIAGFVGYKSKTAFNNAFKKYIGVTPSFYLKSVINKNNNF